MQRRRLLLAIVEVVGESGLEAATVERVCGQAGVSRRTFYEIFEDREGCLLAAFDTQVQRLGESVRVEFENAGCWRERIRRGLTTLLEQFDADSDIARFCVIETPRAGARLIERRREVLEELAATVDHGRIEACAVSDPPPLTAQGVVGGALSVIHARLLADAPPAGDSPADGSIALVELVGPLMAMIVHPYLGTTGARKELELPGPAVPRKVSRSSVDPFKGLPIRFTYRTALVLATIASEGGRGSYPSNRHIADRAGIADEGQTSRLLRRLQDCELIENRSQGHVKGEPNAWTLTERGAAIHSAIAIQDAP